MIPLLTSVLIGSFSPRMAFTENISVSLQEADRLYGGREQPEQLNQSILFYEKLSSSEQPDYEAAWKLSRARWFEGNHAPKVEKKALFQKGIDAGKLAIRIRPDECEGHFWLGINTALLAEESGMFHALKLVDQVKSEIQRAQEIQENCECGGPQRVMGKMYARLPFFKGGSTKKAIESLNRSLELCPNDTQSRLFLAEIYVDENQKGLAMKELKLILNQVPDPQWIPETKENKIIAEKMLNRLEHR